MDSQQFFEKETLKLNGRFVLTALPERYDIKNISDIYYGYDDEIDQQIFDGVIYDNLGRYISKGLFENGGQYNVHFLENGMYYLQMKIENKYCAVPFFRM